MNNFELVLKTNAIFGKPYGDLNQLLAKDEAAWKRVYNQANCLPGEVQEVLDAITAKDVTELRDAVSDVLVFCYGVAAIAGFSPNPDMRAVFESNVSKLCTTQEQAEATVAKYAALGVEAIIKGTVPELYVVSAKDQTDTKGEFFPENKFLKGINYHPPVLLPNEVIADRRDLEVGATVQIVSVDTTEQLYSGVEEMLAFKGKNGLLCELSEKNANGNPDLDEFEVCLQPEGDHWYFYRKDLRMV